MLKTELATPALVVDLDLMEANIASMQAAVSGAGKALRPHAKAHKRVQIAQRQIAAGAVGVCCATITEMETMVNANGKNLRDMTLGEMDQMWDLIKQQTRKD